jgi:hypothetical protein
MYIDYGAHNELKVWFSIFDTLNYYFIRIICDTYLFH